MLKDTRKKKSSLFVIYILVFSPFRSNFGRKFNKSDESKFALAYITIESYGFVPEKSYT